VAASWHGRYDGFRLNTSSWFSYLPGRRFPREAGRWPSRDALVSYYEAYARDHGLEFRLNTQIERVERRAGGGWLLLTGQAGLAARSVVIATGKYNRPSIPEWPGRDAFGGDLLHAAQYRNATPFRGRRVLVAGAGASGFEIAKQLADGGARAVWLAIRTPPHIINRNVGPVPTDLFAVLGRRVPVPVVDAVGRVIRRLSFGDLSRYGLPTPADGVYSRLRRTGMIPTADGPYVDAVKSGAVKVVAAVERFTPGAVGLADGSSIEADAVIAATGYQRALEPLVGGLGVLDDRGRPLTHGGRALPGLPGLYFIGFTEPLSGNLREIRLDADRIARAVART
jgi:cation diffusion facilitator CzcD-associated flavoprotein CzcO